MAPKTKLVAVFLAVLVCLNGGGTLCLAFCQTSGSLAAITDDSAPVLGKAGHCNPSAIIAHETNASAVSIGNVGTCPMAASFFVAPVEKRYFSFETADSKADADTEFRSQFHVERKEKAFNVSYRGPPLDLRIDRIKHCVIRI